MGREPAYESSGKHSRKDRTGREPAPEDAEKKDWRELHHELQLETDEKPERALGS